MRGGGTGDGGVTEIVQVPVYSSSSSSPTGRWTLALGGMIRVLTGETDEANSGRGVHSLQQRHSLAAALHSQNDFAASFA